MHFFNKQQNLNIQKVTSNINHNTHINIKLKKSLRTTKTKMEKTAGESILYIPKISVFVENTKTRTQTKFQSIKMEQKINKKEIKMGIAWVS